MCLAQVPQHSDAGEAQTPPVSIKWCQKYYIQQIYNPLSCSIEPVNKERNSIAPSSAMSRVEIFSRFIIPCIKLQYQFCPGGKIGMGCYVRSDKNSMGCYVRGDKNSMGCLVRGGKSLWDVLSGVIKMAWDVLSRDVLSGSPVPHQDGCKTSRTKSSE